MTQARLSSSVKRDSASKRLAKIFKMAKIKAAKAWGPEFQESAKALGYGNVSEPDWNDAGIRDAAAPVAITLNVAEPSSATIAKAFEKANLNYKNPIHWRLLMFCFAWAHFGERGQGRPPTWTPSRYRQLLKDYHTVVKANQAHEKSDKRACEMIKQRFKGRYDFSPRHMTKLLTKAREAQDREAKMIGNIIFDVFRELSVLSKASNPPEPL
jgi:hypothetical protein